MTAKIDILMKLSLSTIDRAELVKVLGKCTNKADAVAYSLMIAEVILKADNEGCTILLEKQDGTKERLVLCIPS